MISNITKFAFRFPTAPSQYTKNYRYNIHGGLRQSLHLNCQILILFNIFALFLFYPGASCLHCNFYNPSVIYVDSYLSPQYPVCGLVWCDMFVSVSPKFTTTFSAMWSYQFFVHRFKWTSCATLSCPLFHSTWASLLHLLNMLNVVSSRT